MTKNDTESTRPPGHQRVGRRYWFLVVSLVPLGLLIGLTFLPTDDSPGPMIVLRLIFFGISLISFCFWFFLLSRIRTRRRLIGAAILALVAAGATLSVRRVEFSGDLVPSLEYRWSPNPENLLAAHRRGQVRRPLPEPTRNKSATGVTKPDDDPGFRGVARDGVMIGRPIDPSRFRDSIPLWRQPIGAGYSGFAIVYPFAVTLEQRGDYESVTCYDVVTGTELWASGQPAHFSDTLAGDGPRATPCIGEGRVFSLGATGQLRCLDLLTGDERWEINVLEQASVQNVDCGLAASPLVYGSKVFIQVGVQGGADNSRALLTINADDGDVIWSAGSAPAGYASPMCVELLGTPQLLIFDKAGLAAYDLESGTELWRFAWPTESNLLAAQPVVLPDNRVFISNGDDCAVVQISQVSGKWTASECWRSIILRCGYASAVLFEDHLYGLDRGILCCVEAATGRRTWKKGRFGNGQILRVGNQLIVQGEAGEVALVAADPTVFRELARFQAVEGKTWNMPALARGHLLVRNHREMAGYLLMPTP